LTYVIRAAGFAAPRRAQLVLVGIMFLLALEVDKKAYGVRAAGSEWAEQHTLENGPRVCFSLRECASPGVEDKIHPIPLILPSEARHVILTPLIPKALECSVVDCLTVLIALTSDMQIFASTCGEGVFHVPKDFRQVRASAISRWLECYACNSAAPFVLLFSWL
jgi:hypothetical protein